jgi:hypothetical protein
MPEGKRVVRSRRGRWEKNITKTVLGETVPEVFD